MIAKLISRQEDRVTPVGSPPSEGVSFTESSKERSLPNKHPSPFSPTSLSQYDDYLTTTPAEQLPIPEIIVGLRNDLDSHSEPEVNKTHSKSSKRSAGMSTGGGTLPTASDFPTIDYLSPASCLLSPPTRRARCWSRQRGKAIKHPEFSPPIVQRATPPSPISPRAST